MKNLKTYIFVATLLLAAFSVNAQKNWEPISFPWYPEELVFTQNGVDATIKETNGMYVRFAMYYSFTLHSDATLHFTSSHTLVTFEIKPFGGGANIAQINQNGSKELPAGNYYLIIADNWSMFSKMVTRSTVTITKEGGDIILTAITPSATGITVNKGITDEEILEELSELTFTAIYMGEEKEETLELENNSEAWIIAENRLSATYTATEPKGYIFAENVGTITINIDYIDILLTSITSGVTIISVEKSITEATNQDILTKLTELTITATYMGKEGAETLNLENNSNKWEIAENRLSATYTATAPEGYAFATGIGTVTITVGYTNIIITAIASNATTVSVEKPVVTATNQDILAKLTELTITATYTIKEGSETLNLENISNKWIIAEDKLSATYTATAPEGYAFAEGVSKTITVTINYGSNIHEAKSNMAHIYAFDKHIIVQNAQTGDNLSIVDLAGRVVTNTVISNSEVRIPISASGIYAVRIGTQAIKVVCR